MRTEERVAVVSFDEEALFTTSEAFDDTDMLIASVRTAVGRRFCNTFIVLMNLVDELFMFVIVSF